MSTDRLRAAPFVSIALAFAVLALSASAGIADTTTAVNGRTLTITDDDQSDQVALDVVGGHYQVNALDTGLVAGPDVTIAVDLGAGNDTFLTDPTLSGQYGSLVVHGGSGDDFSGSVQHDDVSGSALR